MAETNGNGKANGTNVITPVIAAVSLVASVGVAFWTNSKGDVNGVKYELREDIVRSEDRLMKEISVLRDLVTQKGVYQAEYKEFRDRVDRATDINTQDLRLLRSDLVSRSEHQQHWNEFTSRVDSVRDSLNEERKQRVTELSELRKDFGGTYTLGDVVKQLQDQIKQLNGRLDALKLPGQTTAGTSPTRMSVPPAVSYQPMRVDY